MSAAKNIVPWQPGQSGNPGGRPKLSEELRVIRSLTRQEICKLVSKYARMTKDELDIAAQDPITPMIELTIAAIFAKAAMHGDYTRLSFLLDQAIGKIPVAQETDEDRDARAEIESLTNQELIRLVKEKLPELE